MPRPGHNQTALRNIQSYLPPNIFLYSAGDPRFVFVYKAGTTWDAILNLFCDHKSDIEEFRDDSFPFDLLVIDRQKNQTFLFELKDTDLHQSLFPKNTYTSLERELRGDPGNPDYPGYLNIDCDGIFLIYVHQGLNSQDLVFLDRFMFQFPTVRRKSYISQENAVKGIFRLVKKGLEPLNFHDPLYTHTWALGNKLANMLAVGIDGVSPKKAHQLSLEFGKSFSGILEAMTEGTLIDKLRRVYPDNKNGSHHHMVYTIYEQFMQDPDYPHRRFKKRTPRNDFKNDP